MRTFFEQFCLVQDVIDLEEALAQVSSVLLYYQSAVLSEAIHQQLSGRSCKYTGSAKMKSTGQDDNSKPITFTTFF